MAALGVSKIFRNIAQVFVAFFVTLILAIACTFAAEVITLKPQSNEDERYQYVEVLLSKILEKADVTSKVVQAKSEFSRDRLLQELIKGDNIHVMAEAPKPGWEDRLLPIRIPIRKGIQGYRLFLINALDQKAIAEVETLEDFMRFPTGSGAQWSTRRVMENAGFQVVTSEDYNTLFTMLKLRRFITFGRGINEVFNEQESFVGQNENLVVDQSLCLFIPLPTYFFVSPAHPELAQQIEIGLERMIEDGSFDEHFLSYHQADIERAKLADRKIFNITNPNLSEHTPLNARSYWFDPTAFASAKKEKGS
jgi:hypothetical protein